MRRATLTLTIGLLLAVAAYFGAYFAGTARPRAMLRSDVPALAWLKDEFHLTDAEFERISGLHDAYLPGCAARCERIDAANTQLKELLRTARSVTPEIEKKLAEAAALRVECQKAMLNHFLAVSQSMPPEQGKRYLTWIEQQTFVPEQGMPAHGMAHHH